MVGRSPRIPWVTSIVSIEKSSVDKAGLTVKVAEAVSMRSPPTQGNSSTLAVQMVMVCGPTLASPGTSMGTLKCSPPVVWSLRSPSHKKLTG
jgi:hypothetical protein